MKMRLINKENSNKYLLKNIKKFMFLIMLKHRETYISDQR